MSSESKPHSTRELFGLARAGIKGYPEPRALDALDSLEEQHEAAVAQVGSLHRVIDDYRHKEEGLQEQLEATQSAARRALHELDQWVYADGSAVHRVNRAESILRAVLPDSNPAKSPES